MSSLRFSGLRIRLALLSLGFKLVAVVATLRNLQLGAVELNPLAQVWGINFFLVFACILAFTVPFVALTIARLHVVLHVPMLTLAWTIVIYNLANAVWDLFLWDTFTYWQGLAYWNTVIVLGYLAAVECARLWSKNYPGFTPRK